MYCHVWQRSVRDVSDNLLGKTLFWWGLCVLCGFGCEVGLGARQSKRACNVISASRHARTCIFEACLLLHTECVSTDLKHFGVV